MRDMLFADDAELAVHCEEQLHQLMENFSKACQAFSLTISLEKTNLMGQGNKQPPAIKVNNYHLKVIHEFTYLGTTLSLDTMINRRIGRVATTSARLTTRV